MFLTICVIQELPLSTLDKTNLLANTQTYMFERVKLFHFISLPLPFLLSFWFSKVVNLKNLVQIEVSMSVVFVSSFDDDKRVVSSVKLDYFFFYLNIPKKQGENLGQCETEFSGSRLIYRSSFSNWCDEMWTRILLKKTNCTF